MTTWPDVAMVAVLLAAIVALHMVTKGDPDARATVIVLVAAVSPFLANARQAVKDKEKQAAKDEAGS